MGETVLAATVAEVRRARHRAGLTQKDVDGICGLRAGTIGRMENGQGRPGTAELGKILREILAVGASREATTIGEKLWRARREAGVPRRRLAIETGVPEKDIRGIETGTIVRPEAETLDALFAGLSMAVPAWEAPAEPARTRREAAPRPDPQTLATLRAARLEAGLSAARVARSCGLKTSSYWGLEQGRGGADAATIARIFAAIGENAEPEPATIGGKLRRARYAAGLSQGGLASLAGVGLGTIRQIETGRTHRPKPETLGALFGVIGRPVPEWEAPPDAPLPGQRSRGEYVGLRLAFARAAAGLTMSECARRTGRSGESIRALEMDVYRADRKAMERLTALLGRHGFPGLAPARAAADLGRRVTHRREALGLSRRGLAGLVGATADSVRAAELGGTEPSRELATFLTRLGRALRREEALTPPRQSDDGRPEGGGGLLRAARLRAGLSPAALAERAGVGRQVVLNVERGETLPKAATWRSLRGALGDLAPWPVGGSGNGPPPEGYAPYATLGRDLAALRARLGLNRSEMGRLAGLTQKTIREIEAGRKARLNRRTKEKLEGVLGHEVRVDEPPPGSPGDPRRLAKDLTRARRQAGLARGEVARRAGIHPDTLRRLERGTARRPEKETLRRLQRALAGQGPDAEESLGREAVLSGERRRRA